MNSVNVQTQLVFLDQLNNALKEALSHHEESDPKLDELRYMQSEVNRARRVVSARLKSAAKVLDSDGISVPAKKTSAVKLPQSSEQRQKSYVGELSM